MSSNDVNLWKEIVKGTEYLSILKAPTSIQTNKEVLLELLRFHPEQFKSNSLFDAFKSDPEFMLEAIQIDPTFIEYVSRELLFDEDFKNDVAHVSKEAVERLEEEQKRVEIIDNAFKAGELAVVTAVVAENVAVISFFTDEMKNNYELMGIVSKENEEVQEYVALNKEDFGYEGIKAVKDNIEVEAKDTGIKQIEAKIDTEDKRFAKVYDKIQEVGKEDPKVMRYMSAMLMQETEVDTKEAKKIIEYAILQMEVVEREKDENGKFKTSLETTMKLLPTKLLDKVVEKSGILEQLPEMKEKIEEYKVRSEQYSEQFKAKKIEDREKRKNSLEVETKDIGIQLLEDLKNNGDTKAGKVINKINEVGIEDPKVMRYVTAMIANQDVIEPEVANKIYEYAQLQIQSAVKAEPAKENFQKMIPPTLMKKIAEKLEMIEELPDLEKKLSIYERNYNKCKEKHLGVISLDDITQATEEVVRREGIEEKAVSIKATVAVVSIEAQIEQGQAIERKGFERERVE